MAKEVTKKKVGKKTKAGTKSRFFTFTGFTARMMMAAAAGFLILSYISILVNPARIWLANLLGLLFIPFFLLNAVLLFWALKRRSKTFLIPLLAILPSVFFVGSYLQLSNPEIAEEKNGNPSVRVLSYNVGRFMRGEDAKGERMQRAVCTDSLMAFLSRQDADIICLQEFYLPDISRIHSLLSRRMKGYRYEYYCFKGKRGSFGNLTLSRFKAKDKGVIKFDNSANLALFTDYEVDGRTFRVYNCHFESYNISLSGMLRSALERDGENLREAETKMKAGITRRPKQVDKVFRHIEQSPVEAFVCGDFNDNPMSYTYYKMSRGRKDSFREAGKGFGATYSLLWPLIRIDYVLCPERFNAVEHRTPRVRLSDHYPVITDIVL